MVESMGAAMMRCTVMHLGKQADSALADERLSPQPTLREYPKNGAPGIERHGGAALGHGTRRVSRRHA